MVFPSCFSTSYTLTFTFKIQIALQFRCHVLAGSTSILRKYSSCCSSRGILGAGNVISFGSGPAAAIFARGRSAVHNGFFLTKRLTAARKKKYGTSASRMATVIASPR